MKKRFLTIMLAAVVAFTTVTPIFAEEPTVITWGDETGTQTGDNQNSDNNDADTQNSDGNAADEQNLGSTSKVLTKPYLALGADLSPQQLATVAGLMNLGGEDLSQYDIVYITNDMEHQYLDTYISPSIIGTKSLSSVLVRQAEEGHGVQVATYNINYCTEGMYRNALLTAGVSNADILVVGPSPISGTAALIGAIKAYEKMSGQTVTEQQLDTALDELVTTGEIASENGDSEQIAELIAIIKAELAERDLENREDIEKMVRELAEEYSVSLTEEEIKQIVDLMMKIKDLDLDYNTLLDQAGDLYQKYADRFNLSEIAEGVGKDAAKDAIGKFFTGLFDAIINFFKGFME